MLQALSMLRRGRPIRSIHTTKLAIRATFSLLPASCYRIGALLFIRFSLNESEHAEVRAAVEARNERRADQQTHSGLSSAGMPAESE